MDELNTSIPGSEVLRQAVAELLSDGEQQIHQQQHEQHPGQFVTTYNPQHIEHTNCLHIIGSTSPPTPLEHDELAGSENEEHSIEFDDEIETVDEDLDVEETSNNRPLTPIPVDVDLRDHMEWELNTRIEQMEMNNRGLDRTVIQLNTQQEQSCLQLKRVERLAQTQVTLLENLCNTLYQLGADIQIPKEIKMLDQQISNAKTGGMDKNRYNKFNPPKSLLGWSCSKCAVPVEQWEDEKLSSSAPSPQPISKGRPESIICENSALPGTSNASTEKTSFASCSGTKFVVGKRRLPARPTTNAKLMKFDSINNEWKVCEDDSAILSDNDLMPGVAVVQVPETGPGRAYRVEVKEKVADLDQGPCIIRTTRLVQRRCQYPPQNLTLAVQAVMANRMNCQQAAISYGVPRSTISNKIHAILKARHRLINYQLTTGDTDVSRPFAMEMVSNEESEIGSNMQQIGAQLICIDGDFESNEQKNFPHRIEVD